MVYICMNANPITEWKYQFSRSKFYHIILINCVNSNNLHTIHSKLVLGKVY